MSTPAGTRAVGVARCAWGAVCLVRPAAVVRAAGGAADEKPVLFVRVLGLREIAQGLLVAALPTRAVVTVGVAVDAVHALSLVGLAASLRSYRRPLLANAVTAAGWTVLGSVRRAA